VTSINHGNNSTSFLQSRKQHHLRAPDRRRRITHPPLHAFFIFTKLEQPLRSRCSSAPPPPFLHLHRELTIAPPPENANQRSFLAHHHGHRRPATSNNSLTEEEEAVTPEVITLGTSDTQRSTTLTHQPSKRPNAQPHSFLHGGNPSLERESTLCHVSSFDCTAKWSTSQTLVKVGQIW